MATTKSISYVNYDFDNLVAELQQLLSTQSAWKDMYRSSTGQTLLELFAAVGNLVLYYVERRAEESYISTAQNYSSVVNLARLLNYIPTRNVSATGNITFTLDAAATVSITVPQFTPVSSSTLNFLTLTDGPILVGGTTTTVTGIEGTMINSSYVSNGSTSQEYNIKDTQIENSHIYIYVNNVLWTQQTSFINSTNISTDYVIRPELDGTITIVFGNNVFGMAPQLGYTILVKYIRSLGFPGNLYTTGTLTIGSTIYDQNGHPVTNITAANTTNFLGGADTETIDQIRVNAPQVFATGDRAVTKSDFVSLIKNYPGVADVVVFGENDMNPPNYNMYNQVQITALLQNWILPDATFEADLSTYLYTKSMITVRYSYVPPDILYVVPELTVRVDPSYSLPTIQSEIEAAIQGLFVLGNTITLGQAVYQSDLVEAVEDIDGVKHCHVTLKIEDDLNLSYSSYYTYADTVTLLPLLTNNVELWLNTTQIAVDDGVNGWTDLSTYTVTGYVDYASGLIGANISPTPPGGSTVFVRYQQDNSAITINSIGDLILSQSQICRWSQDIYDYLGY